MLFDLVHTNTCVVVVIVFSSRLLISNKQLLEIVLSPAQNLLLFYVTTDNFLYIKNDQLFVRI